MAKAVARDDFLAQDSARLCSIIRGEALFSEKLGVSFNLCNNKYNLFNKKIIRPIIATLYSSVFNSSSYFRFTTHIDLTAYISNFW